MGCLPTLEMKLAGLHAVVLKLRSAALSPGRGSIGGDEGAEQSEGCSSFRSRDSVTQTGCVSVNG